MTGKLILIIAGTGQGKSTVIKQIIENKPCLVFDKNGEYQHLPYDVTQRQSRFFNKDEKKFIEIAESKNGGCFCVFEEATGFFKGATNKATSQMITGKRHPEALGGRNLIFVFHTIHCIPPEILANVNIFIVGYTMESEAQVKKKHAELLPIWKAAQKMPKYGFKILDRDKANRR